MANEQMQRFEAIALMNKSIAKKTPSEWYLIFDGVVIGVIQKDESGYVVTSDGVTREPFSHFAKAISSMLDNFMRCALYLKTRKSFEAAINNMQPRVKYFAANPNNDPFVITLRQDETTSVSVLTSDGISDFHWCDIHHEKIPKSIVLIPDFISAKRRADEVIESINKGLGNENAENPFFKREIRAMRFSEAHAENIKHYMRQIDDLTIQAHSMGLSNA